MGTSKNFNTTACARDKNAGAQFIAPNNVGANDFRPCNEHFVAGA
jgi:hypothetical protein